MHVLIVEDDPALSRLFARALTKWGWTVKAASRIAEAQGLFRRGRYNLVICDVNLPDGDGIVLARALVKSRPGQAVIVASGNPENLDRARTEGLTACLRKPFALADLRSMVEQECSGNL